MTKHASLDREALRRLRTLLEKSGTGSDTRLPMKELTALAELPSDSGVTIDFEAARELGHPLVVLRPKATGDADTFKSLSPRELEVTALVADGLGNKEIAARLCISLGTVKDHVHHVLEKTGCANRTALALTFRSSGNVHGL